MGEVISRQDEIEINRKVNGKQENDNGKKLCVKIKLGQERVFVLQMKEKQDGGKYEHGNNEMNECY